MDTVIATARSAPWVTETSKGEQVWRMFDPRKLDRHEHFVVETSRGPIVLCEVVNRTEYDHTGKMVSNSVQEVPIKTLEAPGAQ